MKHCPDCKKKRNEKFFHIRTQAPDGLAPCCKNCKKVRAKLSYEKHKEKTIQRVNQYRDRPGYRKACHAWSDIRHRGRLGTIPKWVRLKDFISIYAECQKQGRKYVVDHILPINGLLVSGLHVPENVRVITRQENSIKGESFVC